MWCCVSQLACLTELQQWLSFATDEHLGSFPLQRVLHALFLLLQRRIGGSAAAGGAAETARNVQTDASEAAAALSQEALDEQLARELAGGVDDVRKADCFVMISVPLFCLASSVFLPMLLDSASAHSWWCFVCLFLISVYLVLVSSFRCCHWPLLTPVAFSPHT